MASKANAKASASASNSNVISISRATTKLAQGYRFIDKDPQLDALNAIIAANVGPGKRFSSFAALSHETGISVSCFRAWDSGATRRPQHATMLFAARACGYDFKLAKRGGK